MASQIIYNWTPAGGNSIAQAVDYRRDIDSVWTNAVSGLGPNIDTYTIIGSFEDNRIYFGRITSQCGGNPVLSPEIPAIRFICPTLTLTKTGQSIQIQWTHPDCSIDQYIVRVYDSTGQNQIGSLLLNGGTLQPGTMTAQFNGLAYGTTYKVRVELYAGGLSKLNCTLQSVTTNINPVCNIPSGISASVG